MTDIDCTPTVGQAWSALEALFLLESAQGQRQHRRLRPGDITFSAGLERSSQEQDLSRPWGDQGGLPGRGDM